MKKIIAVLLLAVLALSSCNLDETTKELNLEWTNWNFDSYVATLDFNDWRYILNAGCNVVSWEFVNTQNEKSFKPGISTMMFCADEINKVESELSAYLPTVTEIELSNGTLSLSNWEKTLELTMAVNSELAGNKWSLSSILDWKWLVSDISLEESFIEFSTDWKISGIAVCNNIMWEYEITDWKINISKIATTRKMCAPDSFEESKITKALENIDSFEIVREALVLKSTDWKYKINYSLVK